MLKETKHIEFTAHLERMDIAPWGSLTWMVGGNIGNSSEMTMGRVVIRKGQCNPRHCHPNCEETLYLLEGKLIHTYGDDKVEMNPGDTLSVPAGVFHNARSVGDVDADMIVIFGSADRGFIEEGTG